MAVFEIASLIVILLVLAVGLANFYYSHIVNPLSDVIFTGEFTSRLMSEGQEARTRAKHLEGEFDYWLYFNANNRGDDNAYITSASLKRLEFFNQGNPEDVEVLLRDNLVDDYFDMPPLTILQREVGVDLERGSLLAPAGEVTEVLVVLRIFSGEVLIPAKNFDRTRAVIEFNVVDGEGEYSEVVESEAVRTKGLVLHWSQD